MKSFLRAHLGQQPPGAHSLVGKVIQVSNYSLLCEEQVGTGGYATSECRHSRPQGFTRRIPQSGVTQQLCGSL